MSNAALPEFACEACGKKYKLKPEVAGKRVKCKCGASFTAPKAPPPAEPDEQELYDLVDAAPEKPKAAVAPLARAMPVARPAGVAPTGKALAYESKRKKDRFAADNLIEAKRDIYLPVGLFIVGMIALLVWAIMQAKADSTGVVLFSLLIAVKTFIKTAILIGLAFIVAPIGGLSFGSFWHAILKFAAMIVFADAVLVWTENWIDSLGGNPGGTGFRRRSITGLFKTLILAFFIAIQLRVLFDMDSEETGMIAVPMAIVNRILEFIIWIVLIGILEGMIAAAAPPAVPAAPVATPTGPTNAASPTAAAPAAPAPSAQDQAIRKLIASASEGHEWAAQFHADKLHGVVYETINNARPKRLYFKLVGANEVAVIIELPEDAETRKAVIAAANQMVNRYSRDKTPLADKGQRYVMFAVPNNSKRK